MAGKDAGIPPFAGRILYWRHMCAAMKMLACRACEKQRHLLELTDEDVERIVQQCKT